LQSGPVNLIARGRYDHEHSSNIFWAQKSAAPRRKLVTPGN
jgi:hypothetical protein